MLRRMAIIATALACGCPSGGPRPEQPRVVGDTALRIRVGVEPDEAASYRAAFGDDASWIHVLSSGGNYVRAIRELHAAVDADIYGFAADDFVFETEGWDDRVRDAVADLPRPS